MLVNLKVVPAAVEDLVLALIHDMQFQLAEGLRCAACTHEGTTNNHVAFALFDMCEPVLQLKYLIAMPALDPDLIDNVVEVSVLLLRVEHTLALTTLGATLI